MKKAVLLLSGGLDSATVFAIAKEQGFGVYALSFSYGQRHGVELECASAVAANLGAEEHKIVDIDLRVFGGSALTDDIAVPKDRDIDGKDVPVTYVPARNTIFLSYALAFAETIGAFDIFIGAHVQDYSGYPDCRPEYLAAFENMANLATVMARDGKITIHAPLIEMDKAAIITKGLSLGVDYGLTLSCYDPADGKACGHCDACQIRLQGFEANGVEDPVGYRS